MARKRHLTFSLVVTLLVTFIASQYLSGDLASNEDELSQIKAAIQEKGARWVAQENEISMMDPDARRSLLGLIPETPEGEPLGPKGPVLETNLDWRDYDGHNWMTSVKNQYSCGSCVAFGAIAALEGRLNIFTGDWTWDPDLSEQHLFSCGGGICSFGWWVHSSMNYLQNYGVPEEECFVYWADDRPCSESCSDWEDHKVEIRDWAWVSNDQNTIKSYLQDGPLTTTMDVYTDFFYYSSGVYEHSWGSYEGGHCISFVGWDDTQNCWICKNSWGWTWGESGYFRIRYGDSGIGDNTTYMELYPLIQVYTDKNSYSGGESLVLGAKVVNPGSAYTADVEIWIRLPNGNDYTLYSGVHSIPAGVNFSRDDLMTIEVPTWISEGEYSLYGVIRDSSGTDTKSFDIYSFQIAH